MNPMNPFTSQAFLSQGRNIPAHNHGVFPSNGSPRADNVASKPMSFTMPTINPMDQQLMQLAFQQSARVQKFQIDAAIRLLQMEYETLMSGMTHQPTPDKAHQEALGAVPAISMVGSDIAKVSSPSCPQPGHRADSRCFSEIHKNVDPACSQDRKRNRDEAEVIERDVDIAHRSGHGKVVLTCETACEIYRLRPKVWDRRGGKSDSQSSNIAAKYGVTAKTVRDIW
jgi:hypothetical protein